MRFVGAWALGQRHTGSSARPRKYSCGLVPRMISTPRRAASFIRDAIASVKLRIDERYFESKDALWDRSRRRWRFTQPTVDLTWGTSLTGDAFVQVASTSKPFGPDKSILEIGPGYGRILKSCLELEVPFQSYLGLDISASNVEWLRKTFPVDRV